MGWPVSGQALDQVLKLVFDTAAMAQLIAKSAARAAWATRLEKQPGGLSKQLSRASVSTAMPRYRAGPLAVNEADGRLGDPAHPRDRTQLDLTHGSPWDRKRTASRGFAWIVYEGLPRWQADMEKIMHASRTFDQKLDPGASSYLYLFPWRRSAVIRR